MYTLPKFNHSSESRAIFRSHIFMCIYIFINCNDIESQAHCCTKCAGRNSHVGICEDTPLSNRSHVSRTVKYTSRVIPLWSNDHHKAHRRAHRACGCRMVDGCRERRGDLISDGHTSPSSSILNGSINIWYYISLASSSSHHI